MMRRLLTFVSLLAVGSLIGIFIARTDAATHLVAPHGKVAPPAAVGGKIDTYLKGLASKQQFTGAVLVARKDKVLLTKGYGPADREDSVAYSPTTKFTFTGMTGAASIVAGLRLEAQGKLHDSDRVCSYLDTCSGAWNSITLGMVLDGTSGLPGIEWGGVKGKTVDDSLAKCQSQSITSPDPGLSYGNCTGLVLGLIFERATGKSWATVMKQTIFDPAGMKSTGQITDGLQPPARAQSYSGSRPNGQATFADYFFLYTTVKDVYAFDNALFRGKLLSRPVLLRLIAPRVAVHPPDPNLGSARRGYGWKVGGAFGQQLIYTALDNAINMRFPKAGVSVIVVTNDSAVDVEDVAANVAAMVFGKTIPASIPIAPPVDSARAITAATSIPRGFGAVAATDGAIWVALGEDGSVLRIDPATHKVVATVRINERAMIPADDLGIAELATGNGQLWATDRVNHAIVRIDPATNQVVTRIPVGIVPFGLAITGDTLWTDNSYEDSGAVVNTIVRVDLKTQRAVATIANTDTDIGTVYQALAASPDTLWFDDWKTDTIKRLDPTTNKVVASIKAGPRPAALAVDDGAVWVLDHYADLVTRIDPATNKVVASIPLKGYPGGQLSDDCCARTLAVGAGAVWALVGSGQHTLVRIDPQTNRATASLTFSPQFAGGEVSAGNGGVWALGDQLYRIDPAAMRGSPGSD